MCAVFSRETVLPYRNFRNKLPVSLQARIIVDVSCGILANICMTSILSYDSAAAIKLNKFSFTMQPEVRALVE